MIDPEESIVNELLDLWEDAKEQGKRVSVEELCVEMPQYKDVLRQRMLAIESIEQRFSTTLAPNETQPINKRDTHDGETRKEEAERSLNTTLPPMESSSRFEQVRFHASGSLGSVYRGFDTTFRRWVAIKTIRRSRAKNSFDRSKFRMEAEIASRLDHPAIIPVYCSGVMEDGRPFYVMRFVRGGSLDDGIRDLHSTHDDLSRPECQVTFDRLLQNLIQACRGVAYAHYRGILHRDIKPSHIMLGRYGETLLVDWGLAKPISREGTFKTEFEETLVPAEYAPTPDNETLVVGSPIYMSPTQLFGHKIDPSADIYSLGVTLYKTIVGSVPWDADDYFKLRQLILSGECQRPSERKAGVAQELDAIVGKAMHPSRSDRYQTAGDLAADLERYLAGQPVSALADANPRWAPTKNRKFGFWRK